jgi:membrane protease YdiL (CAAX protease family)
VYELTVSDGRNELHEAIAWYEELADTVPGDPGVQVRLAILYGEAGRTDEVLETVDRWRARGDMAWAEVLAAAYLDAPLEGGVARLREAATRMVEPGWFRDRLLLRLADRADDAAARAAILAEARARTAPLLRRVRLLTAGEMLTLGLGLAGLVVVLRGRRVRVDAALVPPPWRVRDGVEVLVRGAGGGVLVLVIAYALGRWRGPNDPLLSALSMPLMYVPLLWLARRRLFAPVGVGLTRGLGWLPAPGGRRALVVGAGTAIDLALGLLSEATNMSSHWTEWFDEDLAWGSPAVAATSLLGTVLFAPVFEEIVFRGLLYATLRRRLAWPIAATLSAAVFALAHGYGAAGFGSVFLSGLLWAIAYERTGSLLPNTAAHLVNNVAAALGVLLLLR